MLDQYKRIKREHQGEVLFFRLGDFYEMFAEDALEISALLNLTLTSRNGVPMCGVPYHAARSYIARLLKAGKKIAVCEQLPEPPKGGLIDREVVEIITPGTIVDDDYLDKGSANYLACFAAAEGKAGVPKLFSFAYIDLSTGDFYATSMASEGAMENFRQELERLQIKELIIQESLLEEHPLLAAAVAERSGLLVNRWADWLFDRARSRERLERQFGPAGLKGFGLTENAAEIIASGALLDYLDDTSKRLIPHVRSLSLYQDSEFVGIDEATQRNLELVRNLKDGEIGFSLLEVMDETRTAMGRRLLKNRILYPLRNIDAINRRLDIVDTLYHNQEKLGRLRELLGKTPDLERLSSRIAMDKAHAKDLVSVKNALGCFIAIEKESRDSGGASLFCFESPEAAALDTGGLEKLTGLRDLLEKGLAEEPSIVLSEGNLIHPGFDAELDRLRELKDNGRRLLEEYLEEERLASGIPNLKIRYNRLIGYYFEVTKLHLSKAPPHFIRRQGIASGERFSTNHLAELESELNGASEKVVELEKKLFLELREKAKSLLPELAAAGRRIGEIDSGQSLARAATIHGWVRPVVNRENKLKIIEGRHPVVEAHLGRGEFIPNDIILDAGENPEGISFALITGPNMAGKSTYLRQAALITLMAQAGSFVPAADAQVGLVDRIYCRVGASDNLARGESTFLVEMNETAYILHSATDRSLVIMDEVGRGTGTNDGLSIAWAVSEDLLNHIRCRTLFATHYHELAGISHPRMANRSMEVADRGGEIVFLRKLREGPALESYGLHVARLAGLPERVLIRAEKILEDRRRDEGFPEPREPGEAQKEAKEERAAPEAEKAEKGGKILNELLSLDINALTPLEALNLLSGWKEGVDAPRQSRPPGPQSRKRLPDAGNPSLFDN
jgi:DNA mismatch repair protein MutS